MNRRRVQIFIFGFSILAAFSAGAFFGSRQKTAVKHPEVITEVIYLEDATPEPVPMPEKAEPAYKTLELKATAYCSCEKCCGKWALNRPKDADGRPIVYGASGERLIPGVSVAVDPRLIPYGTELVIDGKTYIAHDCGGHIKGRRIDVYFESHEEARQFGVRQASAKIFPKKSDLKMEVI